MESKTWECEDDALTGLPAHHRLSGEQAFEEEEKQDGKAGAGRQGDNPGHKDTANNAKVESADTACQANPQNRADQCVGGRNW